MSLWIVDGGMLELPVVARVEDWEEGSYIEITGSDDGAEWNDAPIRYVAERTCHNVWDVELTGRLRFECSGCGAVSLEITPVYCPACGAKVVET